MLWARIPKIDYFCLNVKIKYECFQEDRQMEKTKKKMIEDKTDKYIYKKSTMT